MQGTVSAASIPRLAGLLLQVIQPRKVLPGEFRNPGMTAAAQALGGEGL